MKKTLISMKKTLISIAIAMCATVAMAAVDKVGVASMPTAQSVDLTAAAIVYDAAEPLVVGKAAKMLAEDIERVTGTMPATKPSASLASLKQPKSKAAGNQIVVVGTIGNSKIIDQLVKAGKLDVSAIQGGWERYIIKCVDNPAKGVERALVIAGSDRRGTAYGALSVSEAIGVSPWYWWADVPVVHKDKLFVEADFTSKEPSVKYRGIFINDEDWGLKPWAAKNYEKELGDIGPRTYARVCELLLRLRGNMLGPAMHECTGAFYSHPDSKVVADSFAIVITTSHCEPLLINNASKNDWDQNVDGDWDYGKNPEGIKARWNKRLAEASQYENMYTTAMRGLHDAGLRGNYTMDEKVPLLERVIRDQRELLTNHIGKPATEIPQIFVPYKETMDVYEHGMKVPEDITLVWVDDNYGYMKRVSSPAEQQRSGHSGVYYHTSYLGAPHDYLWINTTPPALMYNELKKAYDTGADRYWLLNVGDIKPCELGMSTYFAMAWDINQFSFDNINNHQAEYLEKLFNLPPHSGRAGVGLLLDEYYRLAWSRKPEYMGWEREWDRKELEDLMDTDYSFENYNDAQQRLADYRALSDMALAMMNSLPKAYQPAFYEIIGFQCMGSYQMNRKFLMAQLNHELAAKGDKAGANWAAKEAQAAYDSIQSLMDVYNHQLDGKWNHMMAHAPAFRAKHHLLPKLTVFEDSDSSENSENSEHSENSEISEISNHPATMVKPEKSVLEGCTVIDLTKPKTMVAQDHDIRLVEGIGYDWTCLRLGDQTALSIDPTANDAPRVEYEFQTENIATRGNNEGLAGVAPDSVEVTVYTLPIWPLYKGRTCRYGIAVDGSPVAVAETKFKEYSPEWKTMVLQNGAVNKARFAIDKSFATHTIAFTLGDPGMIIQRVVIDWGGLKKTYVGPALQTTPTF